MERSLPHLQLEEGWTLILYKRVGRRPGHPLSPNFPSSLLGALPGTRPRPSPCLRSTRAAKVREALVDWRLRGAAPLPLAARASLFPVPAAGRLQLTGRRKFDGAGRVAAAAAPDTSQIPHSTRGGGGIQASLRVRSGTGERTPPIHKHGPGGQSEEGRGARVTAASPARSAAPLLRAVGGAHGPPGASGLRISGAPGLRCPGPMYLPLRVEGVPCSPVNS